MLYFPMLLQSFAFPLCRQNVQTHCIPTPCLQGVVAIILSWFVSPILSGALAALIFVVRPELTVLPS